MAIDLAAYQKLKQDAETAKTEADRAAGALQTQMQTLKAEFDVDDLDAARTLLDDLTEQLGESEQRYTEELEKFQTAWKDRLP